MFFFMPSPELVEDIRIFISQRLVGIDMDRLVMRRMFSGSQ